MPERGLCCRLRQGSDLLRGVRYRIALVVLFSQEKHDLRSLISDVAAWIERVEGSYSGIMGLPLFETRELLARAGVRSG